MQRLGPPTSDLLNWKLWWWGPVIHILTRPAGCILNLRSPEKADLEESNCCRTMKTKVRLKISQWHGLYTTSDLYVHTCTKATLKDRHCIIVYKMKYKNIYEKTGSNLTLTKLLLHISWLFTKEKERAIFKFYCQSKMHNYMFTMLPFVHKRKGYVLHSIFLEGY